MTVCASGHSLSVEDSRVHTTQYTQESMILETSWDVFPRYHFIVVKRSPNSEGHSCRACVDTLRAVAPPAGGPSFDTLSMALQWANVIDPLPSVTLSHTENTPSAGASENDDLYNISFSAQLQIDLKVFFAEFLLVNSSVRYARRARF